jgi:hypothetical protein
LGLVAAPENGQITLTSDGLDVVHGLVHLPGLTADIPTAPATGA